MRIFYKIFFLFLLISYANAQNKHFKVSYDPQYAPFSYLENGVPQGLLIDYWELWASKNDYTIEFVDGKFWNNALNLAKKGEVDYFLGTFKYKPWMQASKTYYKSQTSLFIPKENSKGFDKNSSYLIGIVGDDYKDDINIHFPNSEIVVYKNYKTIVKDLIDKKIDILYDDKMAIEFYTLRNALFHELKPLSLLQKLSDIQAISNKKENIEIFNEGFKKIDNDELLDIESKWIINQNFKFYQNRLDVIKLTKEEQEFIDNTTINISVSKNWRPVTFQNENDEPSGIANEIWDLIAQKVNLKSNFTSYKNFSDQLDAIKNKKEDVIYSTGKTKDREKYSIFTKPYINFPLSIVTLKDENFIENITYLFGKKVAVGKNYTAHILLKEKYPNLDFMLVKNVEEGLQAVENKVAFAYIDTKPNVIYSIKKFKFDNLKISGNTGVNFQLRMMIRDDYKHLQSILNKVILSLNHEEIEVIVDKWSNLHIQKEFDYEKLWIILVSFSIIISLLVYRQYLTSKKNRELEHLVKQRTIDLIKLNETLEHRVEFKTKELKKTKNLLLEAQKIAQLGSYQYLVKEDLLIWSDELYKIFQLSPKKIKPSKNLLIRFVHEEDKQYVKNRLNIALNTQEKVSFDFRIRFRTGEIKYIQFTSKATKVNSNGIPEILIGTVLDLTKIKSLENEKREQDSILAQQSKMAAMGEMLENIAHQWRQPLSVISTASTGLQIQLELGDEVPKQLVLDNIQTVNKQAQYLSKTIDDFRNFFNPNKIKINFDIEDAIDKSLYLISSKLESKNIQIVKEVENINIYTLENELIQVLLNVFNNAIDALKSINAEQRYIFVKTYEKKNCLVMEIIDSAGGIPKKIIPRVFEPYFTTKHKSQGTGIGLYMSREIIVKHLHGTINVTNKSYNYANINFNGAKFTITIPLKKA